MIYHLPYLVRCCFEIIFNVRYFIWKRIKIEDFVENYYLIIYLILTPNEVPFAMSYLN